jgi:hypothetical protein
MKVTQLTTNGNNTANTAAILFSTKTSMDTSVIKAFLEVAFSLKSGESSVPAHRAVIVNWAVSNTSVAAVTTDALMKNFIGRICSKTVDLHNTGDTFGFTEKLCFLGTYLYVWVEFPASAQVFDANLWLTEILTAQPA